MVGWEIWAQNGPDWPQIGQIRDFSDQISGHFGAARQNILKSDLKSPGFVPLGSKLAHIRFNSDVPERGIPYFSREALETVLVTFQALYNLISYQISLQIGG